MTTLQLGLSIGASLLILGGTLPAQTPATLLGTDAIYSLEQFGPVGSVANAEATFQKASKDIIAAGGGVLFITTNAPATWQPRNNTQEQLRMPAPPAPAKHWESGRGVTVVDARTGTVKIQPPQGTGIEINRTLDIPEGESLSFWGYFPMLSLRNKVLHGSTSYREYLQETVTAGKDRRFYVATIRGVFPGMFMSGGEYSIVQRLYVKSVGYDNDKKMWYFVADAEADMGKGALLGNKNHVNILDMATDSHNENQTFDVRMWRHNYSQGDNYLFDARFKYMGDIHSTSGDENGVIYAAFVESLTSIFRGKVESWTSTTGELKYKDAPTAGKTLGSGRPIINMNPAKWITNSTVMIASPASYDSGADKASLPFHGTAYPTTVEKDKLGIPGLKMGGLIHFPVEAPITDDVIGRYFAVDEPDEVVPTTKDVRRWYLIDSVTKNPDGTKDIRIVRHWWGAKTAGSPMLYKPENYSSDGHEKPLHYIIAPGANAYDVADGVDNPKRTIKLVPTSFTGTPTDFAPGDSIEQAIGPDPFKPTPFRSWVWDKVPGAFPASIFDIANNGVMRDSLFWVHGNSTGDYEKDRATHYDRNTPWDKLLRFDSACNTGIRFGADTADAAILFTQPYHEQPLKWNYDISTNHYPKVASLTVTRDTGVFSFTGPISTPGLSADKTPSRNLRGKNLAVEKGATAATIVFPVEEADGDYAVFLEQNWLSVRAIAKKDAKGFTVQFEKPAPADATLDWMIVR